MVLLFYWSFSCHLLAMFPHACEDKCYAKFIYWHAFIFTTHHTLMISFIIRMISFIVWHGITSCWFLSLLYHAQSSITQNRFSTHTFQCNFHIILQEWNMTSRPTSRSSPLASHVRLKERNMISRPTSRSSPQCDPKMMTKNPHRWRPWIYQ